VAFRRRREGKTDYHQRLRLIVSRKPRLVARGSLGDYVAQIIVTKPEGDQVLAAASAKELAKTYGYKGAPKNTTAAYLTGMLAGLKAKEAGVDEAILDIGLATNRKGSKVYAALKGAIDAGLEIPVQRGRFPVRRPHPRRARRREHEEHLRPVREARPQGRRPAGALRRSEREDHEIIRG